MIVLVNPSSTPSPKKPLPMSLLAVGCTARRRVRLRSRRRQRRRRMPSRAIAAIANRTPLTAIGVTVMPGPQLAQAVPMTRAAQAALPGVPIVWGGYFPSQHADVVPARRRVDYCVRGQGEQTFVALMRVLRTGGVARRIAGLSYRDGARDSCKRRRAAGAARRAADVAVPAGGHGPLFPSPLPGRAASAPTTRRTGVRSRATSARSSGSPIAAGWRSRRTAWARAASCSRRVTALTRCSSTTWTSSSPSRGRGRSRSA